MRQIPPRVFDELASRRGFVVYAMLWIEALNRSSRNVEAVGFWQGADEEEIVVDDLWTGLRQARTFHAAGLEIDEPQYQAGLGVQGYGVRLAGLTDAAVQAFRVYDARGARAQVWRRIHSIETGLPLGIVPTFRGLVNRAKPQTSANGDQTLAVELVSTARFLTQTGGRKKSNAALTADFPGDTFRRHKATTGQKEVQWGSKGRIQ